jgi:hypothetical protein
MSKLTNVLVVVAAFCCAAVPWGELPAQEKKQASTQTASRKCAVDSWRVEALTLYGDSGVVLQKLAKYTEVIGLGSNRVYMFVVETSSAADVALIERKDEKDCILTRWSVANVGDLKEQIQNMVLTSKGQKCVGQQAKELLEKRAAKDELEKEAVPMPKSAQEAVRSILEKYPNDFLRVTFIVLC